MATGSSEPLLKDQKAKYDPSDFRIERVNENDYEFYSKFFKDHFIPREQLSHGLHLPVEEHIISFREHLKTWITGKASVCAVYVPDNKVVGALLTKVLTKNEQDTFGNEEAFNTFSDGIKMLIQVLTHIEGTVNVFDDPSVEKALEFAALTVDSDFAGNGLAHRLVEESEKLGKELGCQISVTQAANFVSQRVFRKLGYEELSQVDYESLEINGKRPLDVQAMNGTTCAIVYRKYLK